MKIFRIFFGVFLFIVTALPFALAEDASPLKNMTLVDTGTVKEVLKPDLILMEDGKRYHFDDILIPVDYAQPAMDRLNATLPGKKSRIYALGSEPAVDRYGIPLVHVIPEGAPWVQADMVQEGLAWVFSSNTGIAGLLRDLEDLARKEHKGFWANVDYDIKTSETVDGYKNSFQIVEGKIRQVTIKKVSAYLNFGDDWKTDFTIELPKDSWRYFSTDPSGFFDPRAWTGRVVRIRGWVENKNGPMIKLEQPGQIEFLLKKE